MKYFYNVAVGVVIVFFVSLGLNMLIDWFKRDAGIVDAGPVVTISGQHYLTFDFDNHTKRTISGLRILVPKQTDISQIEASIPLSLATDPNVSGTSEFKSVSFSGFPGRELVRVYIPVEGSGNNHQCEFQNLLELDLSYRTVKERPNPFREMFIQAIIYATILTTFYTGYTVYGCYLIKKLEKKMDGLIKNVENSRTKLKEIQADDARLRILMLSRLSDYARELSFWRDTIRGVIYKHSRDKNAANSIIEQVKTSLKTYGTDLGDIKDFETIKTLALLTQKREISK